MKVSIAVISYNSEKTILDTLESIKSQTYNSENIELIISDDHSTDDTMDIIEAWCKNNEKAFRIIKVIKNKVNYGISKNCNIVWKECSGEWIKTIAGDDLLDKRCIELNKKYVKKNPDCKIVFSKMQMFGKSDDIIPSPYDIRFFKKNSKQQLNWLKTFSFNIAPSSFIHSDLLKEVGYADEKYRMIEDLPLWIKISKAGYKFHFLNAVTVNYRAEESITISDKKYINIQFINDLMQIYKDNRSYFFKNPLTEIIIFEKILSYRIMILISIFTNNNRGKLSKSLTPFIHILKPLHSTRQTIAVIYNRLA